MARIAMIASRDVKNQTATPARTAVPAPGP